MADCSIDIAGSSGAKAGDLLLRNGDLVLTTDVDANGTDPIQQDLVQRMHMFEGEWFLDTSAGIPYFQEILVKGYDLGQIDALLQNAMLATPGILQLANYSSSVDRSKRSLKIDALLVTQTGTVRYLDSLGATGD